MAFHTLFGFTGLVSFLEFLTSLSVDRVRRAAIGALTLERGGIVNFLRTCVEGVVMSL